MFNLRVSCVVGDWSAGDLGKEVKSSSSSSSSSSDSSSEKGDDEEYEEHPHDGPTAKAKAKAKSKAKSKPKAKEPSDSSTAKAKAKALAGELRETKRELGDKNQELQKMRTILSKPMAVHCCRCCCGEGGCVEHSV
jgi:hypothetical protein